MKSMKLKWESGPGSTVRLEMQLPTREGTLRVCQYASAWPASIRVDGGSAHAPYHGATMAAQVRNTVPFLMVQCLHALTTGYQQILRAPDEAAERTLATAWAELEQLTVRSSLH